MPLTSLLAAAAVAVSMPSEVHIAYGDEVSEMVVAWASSIPEKDGYVRFAKQNGSQPPTSCSSFQLAPQASQLAMNTSADRTTYLYHTVLGGLDPSSTYYYCVGFTEDVLTDPVPFKTRSSSPESTRVMIFGDTGNNHYWSTGTVPTIRKEVENGTVTAVVHTGDFAYYAKDNDGKQGDIHAQEISNLTGSGMVPFMAVPGNAEVFCYRPPGIPLWAQCMEDYQMRFIMPGYEKTHSLWSSFDLGYAHYVLLDSEALLWCGASQSQADQLVFLKNDLEAAQKRRADIPWIFAVVHRPLYSSYNSTGEQLAMRDGFAELLEEYKVDIVFSGHVHSYERTYPVTGNYTITSNATVDEQPNNHYRNPKYPVHIITGAAGNGESIDRFSTYNWTFSAFQSIDIGYSRLTVANKTHLELDFFSITENEVIDYVVIEKDL
eukprot:TRINITY_DN1167_c2_g1_i2.p1 TRINITY_DN1167_c2_g1~~TRINITY_DN1167_c2_g1_i2.p1  ORF type:complete len:446 (+),score=111.39 TRINITY_DN1167_c2_g1_i2:38-1339(+)